MKKATWKHKAKLSTRPALKDGYRLTILGCGTSVGAPVLACRCGTCRSKDPKNHRTRASVLMAAEGRHFLIDTSPDLKHQALRAKLHWIDAVLMTHPHADHLHGLDELRTFNFLMGRPIPVYGNDWTREEILARFSYIFHAYTQEGGGKPSIDLLPIQRPRVIAGVKVIPLEFLHGKLPVLGYRIGPMAYITDISEVPDHTWPLLKDLEILVLDCLRPTPHATHLNVQQAIDFALKVRAQRTYMTHMGHELEYHRFASLLKGVEIPMFPAYDGLTLRASGTTTRGGGNLSRTS